MDIPSVKTGKQIYISSAACSRTSPSGQVRVFVFVCGVRGALREGPRANVRECSGHSLLQVIQLGEQELDSILGLGLELILLALRQLLQHLGQPALQGHAWHRGDGPILSTPAGLGAWAWACVQAEVLNR